MKNKKTIILVSALLLIASVNLWAQQRTVAVSLFEARGALSQDVADVVTELVMTELVADKTVRVVARNSFDAIIAEMKFQATDWTDSNMVVKLGKALGADSLIRGTAMSMDKGGPIIITSNILDMNTSQILYTSRLQVNNTVEIFEKIPDFVKGLVRNLWSYKIGDKGPGGGIIFFAEGGKYMEAVSIIRMSNYQGSVNEAKNYRGGGYTDWRLPDEFELNMVYQNLVLLNKHYSFYGTSDYFSSTYYGDARYGSLYKTQDFRTGVRDREYFDEYVHYVCAIRTF